MKLSKVPLLLLLPLLISACDSQQPSYSASNATSAPPAPQQAPAQEAPPPAPPAAVATEKHPDTSRPAAPMVRQLVRARPMPERPEPLPPVNSIGIGGCDDFINRYRTCVNKGVADGTIPIQRRSPLVRTFNVQVRQWQADLAAGKTGDLVTACAEADKRARPELARVGCTSF